MKKIGVVLSGCGVYDGSEIHEAVITLLFVARAGAKALCFAPDKLQADVINHVTGDAVAETRNVLTEAARIARGDISPLTAACPETLDGLIVTGGFGAAKNLCDFAGKGKDFTLDPDFMRLSQAMFAAGKPQGFICIAPVMLPKLINAPLRLTIGTDIETSELIDAMGATHVACPADDIVVDEEYKVVTTPAYMLAKTIDQAATGIEKLVNRVLDLCQ